MDELGLLTDTASINILHELLSRYASVTIQLLLSDLHVSDETFS